jgi:hypothetical protein
MNYLNYVMGAVGEEGHNAETLEGLRNPQTLGIGLGV